MGEYENIMDNVGEEFLNRSKKSIRNIMNINEQSDILFIEV